MSPLVLALVASLGQDGCQVRKDHPGLLGDDPKAVVSRALCSMPSSSTTGDGDRVQDSLAAASAVSEGMRERP